jgi:hypothetical protein
VVFGGDSNPARYLSIDEGLKMKILFSLKSKLKSHFNRSRRAKKRRLNRRKHPVIRIHAHEGSPSAQYARIPVVVEKKQGS